MIFTKLTSLDFFRVLRKPNETASPIEGLIPSSELLSLSPYKSYVALLNQSGTDAPTATVLENNTGLTFTPSYDDVGLYFLEPDTAPASDKVAVFCTNGAAAGDVFALWREDKLNISTRSSGAPTDSILSNSAVEIRIYP